MTTTENPTGSLTRRQLRELRATGQAPVVGEEKAEEPQHPAPPRREPVEIPAVAEEPEASPAPEPPASSWAPSFARESSPSTPSVEERPDAVVEPAPVATPEPHVPVASAPVEEEHAPRSRREARELERVRTGAIQIVQQFEPPAPAPGYTPKPAPGYAAKPASATEAPVAEDMKPVAAKRSATDQREAQSSDPGWAQPAQAATPAVAEPVAPTLIEEDVVELEQAQELPVVDAGFGSAVLEEVVEAPQETSFDELLTHDSSGSTSTAGHALIMTDSMLPPLTAPVAGTGQTLVTGIFDLPDGLGSLGHAPGTTDGKDVDAVLIDGELPVSSSPTPIAATAAVNQAKAPGEILKPPAPEKSNKLLIALAITAGVLALALTGGFIYAALSGVLS